MHGISTTLDGAECLSTENKLVPGNRSRITPYTFSAISVNNKLTQVFSQSVQVIN